MINFPDISGNDIRVILGSANYYYRRSKDRAFERNDFIQQNLLNYYKEKNYNCKLITMLNRRLTDFVRTNSCDFRVGEVVPYRLDDFEFDDSYIDSIEVKAEIELLNEILNKQSKYQNIIRMLAKGKTQKEIAQYYNKSPELLSIIINEFKQQIRRSLNES